MKFEIRTDCVGDVGIRIHGRGRKTTFTVVAAWIGCNLGCDVGEAGDGGGYHGTSGAKIGALESILRRRTRGYYRHPIRSRRPEIRAMIEFYFIFDLANRRRIKAGIEAFERRQTTAALE